MCNFSHIAYCTPTWLATREGGKYCTDQGINNIKMQTVPEERVNIYVSYLHQIKVQLVKRGNPMARTCLQSRFLMESFSYPIKYLFSPAAVNAVAAVAVLPCPFGSLATRRRLLLTRLAPLCMLTPFAAEPSTTAL